MAKRIPKKMNLYFDKNDEMVEEEVALADPHNYYHKYHSVEVEFGSEDDDDVKAILTKDIFWGEKKTDNAQIFIETLMKTKAKY